MWKAFLLCFLVALSVAEQQWNGAWRQNTEYRYKVHTKTLAALPNLKNQWVGSFTKADLTIRQLSKDVLVGEVKNGKRSDFHDALPMDPAKYMPDDELQYEQMEMNTKPFEIRMDEGAIHSIAVDKDMTNVQLNQLKSILSQLQVDIRARNNIESVYSHLPDSKDDNDENKQNQALYQVMEPTVTGKCESYYDISRIPMYMAQSLPEATSSVTLQNDENVYEIFKTKNYSNCEQRMGYHFGLDGLNEWKPNTNRMGSLAKSAISRIVISGNLNKYTIRSSVTTNRVVKSNPGKETQQDSLIVSQVNVTLESMEQNEEKPLVQSEQLVDVGNLVYSYDLPSDKKNSLRPKKDSSEETDVDDDNDDSDDEEERDEENSSEKREERTAKKNKKHSRNSRQRRSTDNEISKNTRNENEDDEDEENQNDIEKDNDNNIKKNKNKSNHNKSQKSRQNRKSSRNISGEREDESSNEKKLEYHQPRPTLKDAPENPLLNYFVGNNGKSIQSRKEFNAKTEVEKLVEEISEDLENPEEIPAKNTLRKFNILAKIIRTMNAEQIEETTRALEKMDKKSSEKSRKVYLDALSTAGTGPAVNQLMTLIEERKLKGEEAVEVIITLPTTIREPTEEMQRRFFDFVKNDAVREQSNVNTTAGIALSRFLHQAQVNRESAKKYYPVESYGRLGDRNSKLVSEEVIPYFAEMLKKAVDKKDVPKTLYAIRALGNLGDSKLPKVFEPYLTGKEKLSNFQRFAVLVAMGRYCQNNVKDGQTMLYKIFQDKGETSEIRSLAVFKLVRLNPLGSILLRMAETTNNEENNDVRAAVRSALESAARLQENTELAQNAKAALGLMKQETQGMQYARTYLTEFVDRQIDATYKQQATYLVEEDSFIPNAIYVRTVGNLGGFNRDNEFHAIVSSIKELANAWNDNIEKSSKTSKQNDSDSDESNENDYLNNDSNQEQSTTKWSAEKIMNLLNMKKNKAKQLEGQLMLNFANSERFVAFDRKTLDQLPQTLKKIAKEIRNGYEVKYTKLYNKEDATISFPLETGVPFTFTQRSPTVIQVKGQVRVRTTPDMNENDENNSNSDERNNERTGNNKKNKMQIPKSVNASASIELTYSTNNEVSMSFTEPSTGQRYSATYDKMTQVNVPLRISSDIDVDNREIKTEVKPLRADKEMKILQMKTTPYTVRDNIFKLRPMPESPHTKEIRSKSVLPWNVELGEKATGFAWKISGKQEKGSNQIANIIKQLRQRDLTSILMFGQEDTSAEQSSLTVSLDGKQSTSKTARLTIKYDKQNAKNENQNQNNIDRNRSHPRSRGQSAEGHNNLAKPDSTKPNSQERREQLLRNAAEDMGATNGASVLDISVEFTGSKKREYVATVSTASSKTEGKSRLLVFAQKSESESESTEKSISLQVDAKYQNADQPSQSNQANNKPYADIKITMTVSKDKESATVRGKVEMKQSTELKEQRQEDSQKSPKKLLSPNAVDHMDIELDVNDAAAKMLEKSFGLDAKNYYNYLRYSTSMYLNENKEYADGQKDKVRLEVRLSSDMKSADLTLKTENMKTEWKGVPVPMARTVAVVPSNGNLLEEMKREYIQYRDTCVISGDETNTFENRTVKTGALAKNTWYLAVHQMRENENDNENENDDKKHSHYASILVREAKGSNRQQESNWNNRQNREDSNEQESIRDQNSMKRANQKNKEVLIVLHQKNKNDITLRLAPRDNDESSSSTSNKAPRLFVDGNEKDMNSKSSSSVRSTENPKEVLARVYVTKEQQSVSENPARGLRVETKLGDLEVKYDGKSVEIRSKSMYRGNRGMCGAFTGQKTNDLKSPQNKIINNDKEFAASWAIVENDSNADNSVKQLQQRIKQKQYPSEETLYSDPIPNMKKTQRQHPLQSNKQSTSNDNQDSSNSEQGRRNLNSKSNSNSNSNSIKLGTKHQTQFVEDTENDRICFSKRPLPVCPTGSRADGKTQQKVEVICRPSNDPAAKHYKSQIKQGRNVNMSMHASNDSLTFSVPKRCEQL
ncbi:vitellogenin-A1-like [Contarinia nasturtii]|uniref:vitellogenin-A1-like n=1 Tax=Contarinia nasturtii TaxID=265458 RepID=UPI0012D487D5|nr:vitellogenin-A1-like [Contarinia nasturtii]